MARVTILYWQDIPSVVEANDGTTTHKEQLSQRFQELIDLVAMKKQLGGTDAYLEHWNKGQPAERPGSAKDAASAAAREIEARFDAIRAAALGAC